VNAGEQRSLQSYGVKPVAMIASPRFKLQSRDIQPLQKIIEVLGFGLISWANKI
jgi:hypothetical protein